MRGEWLREVWKVWQDTFRAGHRAGRGPWCRWRQNGMCPPSLFVRQGHCQPLAGAGALGTPVGRVLLHRRGHGAGGGHCTGCAAA